MPNEISGINAPAVHQANAQRNGANPQAKDNRVETPAQSTGDSVNLTDTASRLQQLETRIASEPVVDTARVEALRQEVANGSYQVDAQEVATKILDFEADLSASK